jgi:hypothetical protein
MGARMSETLRPGDQVEVMQDGQWTADGAIVVSSPAVRVRWPGGFEWEFPPERVRRAADRESEVTK